MYLIGFLAALLAIPIKAAPSFDCKKARLNVEKIICSDDKLAELDELLANTYKENIASSKTLIVTQKRWLRQSRNRCKDKKCLEKVYTDRINSIDPFADKDISCEKMRKYTRKIFNNKNNIDFGSGSVSPINFDFRCKESLVSLPFLSNLLQMADTIRSVNTSQECSGTLSSALHRYYLYNLTKAGFFPSEYSPHVNKKLPKYFHRWSLKSLYNFQLRHKYLAELEAAKGKLTKYYRTKFKLPLAKAKRAADTSLNIITDWAAGSFPSTLALDEPSKLIRLAADSKSTTRDLQKLLAALAQDPTLKKQAYEALKVSLLLNKARAFQQRLVDHIGNLGAKDIVRGEESEIFFALQNQNNVEYLLNKGALIDYQNTFGKTALFYAIESNNRELVKLLIVRGADVNHPYKSKKELLDDDKNPRCDINIEHTKRTPLMHAAQHGNVDMLQLLLNHKARLQEVDEQGLNALDYALMANEGKSEEFLKKRGLKPKAVEDIKIK